jgi:hypothetical protein
MSAHSSTKPKALAGKLPAITLKSLDADHGFVLALLGMEMRWPVIGKIHADDNAVKAANFRHGWARA